MPPQTNLQFLTPLLSRPSFTSKEAKMLGGSAAALSRYVEVRQLKRVRRGVYQATNYQNLEAFR